ncbi:hypothetical protein [Halosegnis sp.]|uniref:hypothetical protein n=1 Tax=Halosegnis sp. TaxID=2864959 RepID=UPI0035D43A01
MAGVLNTVYIIVATLVAVLGVLFVASTDTTESSPRWLEVGAVATVLVFLLAMGAQLLA